MLSSRTESTPRFKAFLGSYSPVESFPVHAAQNHLSPSLSNRPLQSVLPARFPQRTWLRCSPTAEDLLLYMFSFIQLTPLYGLIFRLNPKLKALHKQYFESICLPLQTALPRVVSIVTAK